MEKWEAFVLGNEEGSPCTRDELIQILTDHIDKGFEQTGSYDFFYVNSEDGTICFTGNGKYSEKIAKQISILPEAVEYIKETINEYS
jgi:hypothetical protein